MVEKASDPWFSHIYNGPKSSKMFVDDAEKPMEGQPAQYELASSRGQICWSHLGKSIFI